MLQSGEPRHIQALWHFAEGLFYFLNYFSKKEGFLRYFTVLRDWYDFDYINQGG